MSDKKIYFVSDAHFGISLQGHEQRELLFIEFLHRISADAEGLIILGDLFDFWIEYRCAIRPDYFSIVHELRKLVEKGIWIHYMAGNHDFALGPFLKETIGIVVHNDSYESEFQGKKVHLFHGDGLLRLDSGYRVLRKILRNPTLQQMYKMIHPNLGVPLGTYFSGSSRKYLKRFMAPRYMSEYRKHAQERLANRNDIVIFGHTHHAELCHFYNGTYCNTGAWLVHYNYATMSDSKMRLWKYNSGADPEELHEQKATN